MIATTDHGMTDVAAGAPPMAQSDAEIGIASSCHVREVSDTQKYCSGWNGTASVLRTSHGRGATPSNLSVAPEVPRRRADLVD